MNNEEHVYIKFEDDIFILDDDSCVEQKSSHTRRGRRESE